MDDFYLVCNMGYGRVINDLVDNSLKSIIKNDCVTNVTDLYRRSLHLCREFKQIAIMFNIFSSKPKVYTNLSGKAFQEEFEKEPQSILLDVRTREEFQSGTIKNARNINVMASDFQKQVERLDKNHVYFVFCQSGTRSKHACQILGAMGLRVYNLQGGIHAWPQ
jgi:rhodanese-related sulfurtransferase